MSCAFCKVNSVSSYGGCPVHPTRSHSRNEAGDKLEAQEEKHSTGEIIWGEVCARSLVPSDALIFVSDLYQEYEPPHPKPSIALCMQSSFMKKLHLL